MKYLLQYFIIQNTIEFDVNFKMKLMIYFSLSLFFYIENTKSTTPRKELSFSSFNKPSLKLQGNSISAKDSVLKKLAIPDSKLSPTPRNTGMLGAFSRQESLYSDAGSFCGHDDSTTTSGSYVLDQEDLFDGLSSSLHRGQCIV